MADVVPFNSHGVAQFTRPDDDPWLKSRVRVSRTKGHMAGFDELVNPDWNGVHGGWPAQSGMFIRSDAVLAQ